MRVHYPYRIFIQYKELQQQEGQVKAETFLGTRSMKGCVGDTSKLRSYQTSYQALEGHSCGDEESKALYIPNTTNMP